MLLVQGYAYGMASASCQLRARLKSQHLGPPVLLPPLAGWFSASTDDIHAAAGGGRRLHEFDLALGAAAGGRVLGEAGARLGVGRPAQEEEVGKYHVVRRVMVFLSDRSDHYTTLTPTQGT